MPPTSNARKRQSPPASRARKRQKRLDAIVDRPPAASSSGAEPLRRSSRKRRAPQVFDSSPAPSRKRRVGGARRTKGRKKRDGDVLEKGKEPASAASEEDPGVWNSRLRSRSRARRKWDEKISEIGFGILGSRKRGRKKSDLSEEENQDAILIGSDEENGSEKEEEEPEEENNASPESPVCGEPENVPEVAEQEVLSEKEVAEQEREVVDCIGAEGQEEAGQPVEEMLAETANNADEVDARMEDEDINGKSLEIEDMLKENELKHPVSNYSIDNGPKLPVLNGSFDMPQGKEGRRCGLCGGGVDGRPPKKLVRESTDSDNEAYEGSSASEEPNYDVWDGFGDEPGWLGRLLGPVHDRFGIARVWVHQHCAVWSPEVYFAGLGRLKNVRAALCRGRVLKCSRCGRPGATIGCRVDRCPKTYHLPCSRADGCIFDHRKFLIACPDHRRLFQPQGDDYTRQIRKMKVNKLKLDLRKVANDAMWKDLESEEKWLETRGEDEEFLKRESKRFQRDMIRIAPVYIGGSSANNLYEGWESVAGLQDVIQCMKEIVMIPLLYPEFFANLSLTPPRGVLLHGYPGTGKTLVVRALIGACSRGDKRIAYFARKGADCLGKYVGDAERQLRLLFQVAERSQPSIIFFDEIDGLAPCRSRHQDQTHCSVVSTLLSLMDGLKSRGSVIVIGATNRPDAVDPALRRPGRFDREIYFPLPSLKDRSAILSLHTKSWPNPLSGSLLSWVSSQTAGYAGADLQSLCTQAAMNALKRSCALQELLSSAEKGCGHGKLPALPSFVVEERDWLAALAYAPPPCSRREAGMAANDIVSSPLYTHLIPCLLEPLSHMLISFDIDERIWLPPPLLRASKLVKNAIFSSLQQKRIPTGFWELHFHQLIQETCVSNEIEKIISHHGLLVNQPGIINPYVSDNHKNHHDQYGSLESVESYLTKLRGASGFRSLVAGPPRSGQHHFASCLLHAFAGHIEIQKVNLATISQEGHGDIIRGLTQLVSKCLNMGRCMIYMPRIDLWAMDELQVGISEEGELDPESSKCSSTDVLNTTKQTSEAWNSFVEHVDSICASATIIILATCEMQNHALPDGIRQFFGIDASSSRDSVSSEHSIPRFFVHVDGKYNHDLVLDSSAAKVSQDLVQHFVQLVHHRHHMINLPNKNNRRVTAVVSPNSQSASIGSKATIVIDTSAELEQIAANSKTFCGDKQTDQGGNTDQRQSPRSCEGQIDIHYHSYQEVQRTSLLFMKGAPTSAIAMFGYQILRCRQFAELCWVTSKLKYGPCTDTNGPWKGWPFNSCVMHPSSSPMKVVAGGNSVNRKERDFGIVRGLVAVGLLALKGAYKSSREVSLEVRKVLELLVGRVRDKILSGKESHQYLRLLSQVAYLEDMVNSWAYAYYSLQTDNLVATSNLKTSVLEGQSKDDKANDSILVDNVSCKLGVSEKSCNEGPDRTNKGHAHSFGINSDDCTNEGLDLSFAASVAPIRPEVNHLQTPFSLSSLHSNSHPSSSLVGGALDGGRSMSKVHDLKEPMDNGLAETNILLDGSLSNDSSFSVMDSSHIDRSNDLSTVPSSDNAASISKEADLATGCIPGKKNCRADPEISCLYNCCLQCMRILHVTVRNVLLDRWRSTGCHSTVDDIHDTVALCSLDLQQAIKNYYNSHSSTNSKVGNDTEGESRTKSEQCTGQEIGDDQPKCVSSRHGSLGKTEFLLTQCSCHIGNKEGIEQAKCESNCLYQPPFRFFFKGGVLVPANPPEDVVFHCRYENLCVCSIARIILMVKQSVG